MGFALRWQRKAVLIRKDGGGNPNHDEKGRFSSGGSGGSGALPREWDHPEFEADDGIVPDEAEYHGTTAAAMEIILKNGFVASKSGRYGPGVYLSTSKETAQLFGDHKDILKVAIPEDIKLKEISSGDFSSMGLRANGEDVGEKESADLQKKLQAEGYDGIYIPNAGTGLDTEAEYITIFDPKKITHVEVAKAEAPKVLYYARVPKGKLTKTEFKTGDRVRVNVGEQCAGKAGTVKLMGDGKVMVNHDGSSSDCAHSPDQLHIAHEFNK